MKKIYLLFCLIQMAILSYAQPCNFTYSFVQANKLEFYPPSAYQTSGYYFQWDFGDGSSIYADTIDHTFQVQGNQNITLRVYENVNNTIVCSSTQSVLLTFCDWHYQQDTANPQTFVFWAALVQGNTAEWDFGDSTVLTGDSVTHSYSSAGTYAVLLRQKDTSGTVICTSTFMVAYSNSGLCSFDINVPNPSVNPMYFVLNALVPSSNGTVSWNYDVPNVPVGYGYWTSVAYGDTGTYNICMSYTGNDGYSCQVCQPVVAMRDCWFTNVLDNADPQTMHFTASNITSGNQYIWDFGDGQTVTGGDSITHTYSMSGFYNVCMQVQDTSSGAITCSYCNYVVVNINPYGCQANFRSVSVGAQTYFIDQSFSVIPTNINYSWDFGDGSVSSLRFPQHTYTLPGTYMVCLYLNGLGCNSSYCTQIVVDTNIVAPAGCHADFIFTQTTPFQVVGVNLSSGSNLSFNWDFGDGNTATGALPSHQYTSTGVYQICLTVADNSGCTDTYCDTLTVDANGNIMYRGVSTGFVLNILSPDQVATGLKDMESERELHIYPVPAQDHLDVKFASDYGNVPGIYEIIAVDGRKKMNGSLSEQSNRIEISSLTPGIYLFKALNADGQSVIKTFVKQ